MKITWLLVSALLLVACGGGGGGSSGADPSGVYNGTFTESGAVFSLNGVIDSRGRAHLFSVDGQALYVGNVTTSDNALNGSVTRYLLTGGSFFSIVGQRFDTVALSGTVQEQLGLAGTFSASGAGQFGTFALTYEPTSAGTAPISEFAGTYTNQDINTGFSFSAAVNADGAITASDSDGCNYSGNLTSPDDGLAVLEATLQFTCPGFTNPIQVSGIATLLRESPNSIVFILSNNDVALAATVVKVS